MAYTIDYTYSKILEAIDKDGSDFFNIANVMRQFESSTYDFIEKTYNDFGKNQMLTDVLKPLYKPFSLTPGVDSVYKILGTFNIAEWVFTLPIDYLHLISVNYKNNANVYSRSFKLIPPGKLDAYIKNPNTRPDETHPIGVLLTNTLNIYVDGNEDPSFITGFYLKKPTFGDSGGITSAEITVDLEDFVVEKIIKITANELLLNIGDPRAIGKYQVEREFRNV